MKSLINIISAINVAKHFGLKYIALKEQPSKISYEFLNILMKEGFLRGYSIKEFSNEKHIKIDFKFSISGSNILSSIRLVGGNTKYTSIKSNGIWKKEKGQGIILIMTPQGLFTDSEARRRNLGGKILAIIV